MIKINVLNHDKSWTKSIKKPKKFFDKKIKVLNKKNQFFFKNNFKFTILLSNNKEIKFFNNKFRRRNKPTDIISFPFQTNNELKKKIRKKEKIYLGDIIISINKVKKKNFIKNLNILWIHGLAHLLGYRHKKNSDFNKMYKFERKLFNQVINYD